MAVVADAIDAYIEHELAALGGIQRAQGDVGTASAPAAQRLRQHQGWQSSQLQRQGCRGERYCLSSKLLLGLAALRHNDRSSDAPATSHVGAKEKGRLSRPFVSRHAGRMSYWDFGRGSSAGLT